MRPLLWQYMPKMSSYCYSVTSYLFGVPTYLLFFVEILDEKRFMELLTSLQYKPLYNINRSEKWGKKNTNRGL